MQASPRWGSSWNQWTPVNTPQIDVHVFSNTGKKIKVDVLDGAVKINEFTMDATKGFNHTTYDVSFSKKGRKAYEKAHPKSKLRVAQNGIYYLPKGSYTLAIENQKQSLEIK